MAKMWGEKIDRGDTRVKLVRNIGVDRVIDLIRPGIGKERQLDVVSPVLSLFAFAELVRELDELPRCRLVLPSVDSELGILGSAADRAHRNRLQSRWLARRLIWWLREKTEVRRTPGSVPQGAFILRDATAHPLQALLGSLSFSTEGLGLTPGNPMNLIQASETPEEAALLGQWYDSHWSELEADAASKSALINILQELAANRDPFVI